MGTAEEHINGGFDSVSAVAGALVSTEAGALSAIVREESELKAAIVVAKKFPRNEEAAFAKLLRSCKRPSFAEAARYSFDRGSSKVTGPSVDLAREAARCWGNIRYGLRIVTEDEDRVHIKGFALDLESNNYVEMEDKFSKLVFRKSKGWIKPDERDLRELVNRRGAICVRNALLQLLPPDVVDRAMAEAEKTMREAAEGSLKRNMDDAIRDLVVKFDAIGVTVDMLETRLAHPLKLINRDEYVELLAIGKSILDGNSRREEHFPYGENVPDPKSQDAAAELNEKLKKKREELKTKPVSENGGTYSTVNETELQDTDSDICGPA